MKNDLITLYVVNKNHEKFLNQCLLSIENQSYNNIELIIIDDHSSDNSIQLIQDFKFKKIKKIKFFFNKKSLGLVKNINKVIKVANGKFILRLDSDDFLRTNALKKLSKEIKKHKATMVFPNFFKINSKSKIISTFDYNYKKFCEIKDEPAHGACNLTNLNFLKKINGYNSKFKHQDGHYLWYSLFKEKSKIIFLKENLFYYRQHKKNISKNEKRILYSRLKIINFFIKQNLWFKDVLKKKKFITLNKLKKINT